MVRKWRIKSTLLIMYSEHEPVYDRQSISHEGYNSPARRRLPKNCSSAAKAITTDNKVMALGAQQPDKHSLVRHVTECKAKISIRGAADRFMGKSRRCPTRITAVMNINSFEVTEWRPQRNDNRLNKEWFLCGVVHFGFMVYFGLNITLHLIRMGVFTIYCLQSKPNLAQNCYL